MVKSTYIYVDGIIPVYVVIPPWKCHGQLRVRQVFEDEILDAKIAAELMGEAPVGSTSISLVNQM